MQAGSRDDFLTGSNLRGIMRHHCMKRGSSRFPFSVVYMGFGQNCDNNEIMVCLSQELSLT
jgi:hypothetical protein